MDELLFARCAHVNQLLVLGKDHEARDSLIQILDDCQKQTVEIPPLVNQLIRSVGLYPYLNRSTANWSERVLLQAFSADAGGREPVVLHREQCSVLKRLVEGESLALSAPTSFGKSFVIDAFIAISRPGNVLIIVPTLALADETRRRLQVKFGHLYAVITATEMKASESRNIFIFPQERAISYGRRMPHLDLLIVDEFYKASQEFDPERSAPLIRAILRFGEHAKQKYFLAPNISSLGENPFTHGMKFLRVEFNTVFLRKHETFRSIGRDAAKKSAALLEILSSSEGKTLVYAGTYSGISEVANLLLDSVPRMNAEILEDCREWLIESYGPNWLLPRLVRRGVGIHNGQLHRSLSQLQIKLFEQQDGLKVLLSTSSIIEGVNTSAQNVILWRNKNGSSKLTDFEYRNIIGRSGRMFRHFVGEVYILEEPPASVENQLTLDLPDTLLGLPEIQEEVDLSRDQRAKADEYNREMTELVGEEIFAKIMTENNIQTSNSDLVRKIVSEIRRAPGNWQGIGYLNSNNPDDWTSSLYKVLELEPGIWDVQYRKFVAFIKIVSQNWKKQIPELLEDLAEFDIDLDSFFKLERNLSYKFAALLGDLNSIYRSIRGSGATDVSPFIFKATHAFLPPVVFQLEEYGLPRMISRKLHGVGLIDFEDQELTLSAAIDQLLAYRDAILAGGLVELTKFEEYILRFFFEGITPAQQRVVSA